MFEFVDIDGLQVYPVPMRGFLYNERCDAYLVRAGAELLMVDSGPDLNADSLISAVEGIGQGLSAVVNTHEHFGVLAGDHAVISEFGCGLMAPSICADVISGYGGLARSKREGIDLEELSGFFTNAEVSVFMNYFSGCHASVKPVEVSLGLEEGQSIECGDAVLEVIATPGHSPGHVCLLERRRGVLFSGGSLLAEGVADARFRPFEPDGQGDLSDHLESLENIGKLDFRALFSSSGYLEEGGARRAGATFDYYMELAERVLEAVGSEAMLPEQVASAVSPGSHTRMESYVKRCNAVSMLEMLESRGEIVREEGRYRAV